MKNIILILSLFPFIANSQHFDKANWEHVSTSNNKLEIPFTGEQQTASMVVDIDNDGIPEIFVTERTKAPSVVMYKNTGKKWERFIIDNEPLKIEAGSTHWDITGNGSPDLVFGGDGSSNEIWWWENPYPNFDKNTPWVRRNIKKDGARKHHDVLFGDFTGIGKGELVFWNQGANALMIAEIPDNVREVDSWDYKPIYEYSGDSEMVQHGHEYLPPWKSVNEHEGLTATDIDGDGLQDIVGAGLWLKYNEVGRFIPNLIDARYTFSRVSAGQLIEGGRPEIILVPGDGKGPLIMYEWKQGRRENQGTWFDKVIHDELWNAHSVDIIDFNGDGYMDIFVAEMNISGENPDARAMIFFGNGRGDFKEYIITKGFGHHESRIVDLNGDGLYDIMGKPYNWSAPRLDFWLNKGKNDFPIVEP
jgi:hypothetical protein